MNWYFQALRKFAVFNGRATRSEFWYFQLFSSIIIIGISYLSLIFFKNETIYFSILTILVFIHAIAIISLVIRRFHDINKSAWWCFLYIFIPIIGIVYMCIDSKEDNEYGPNPKNISLSKINEEIQIKENSTQLNSNTENKIYEDIMAEIDENKKIKSTWAKALSQSDGNENKANSLYITLRVNEIKDNYINDKNTTSNDKNSEKNNSFVLGIVVVFISIVIIGTFYDLFTEKKEFDKDNISEIQNSKFNIKEINNIDLGDNFITSCEKLKLISPNNVDDRIIPGEEYYWCGIKDGDINLISYDKEKVDGFVTSYKYNKFDNFPIEKIKTIFRGKGYGEFLRENNNWVSLKQGENYVLLINDYEQIFYLSLDKYIQNKNARYENKNIKKVKDYVLNLDKSITIGDAFDNYSDCKNIEWKELITSNNAQIVEFSCDITSERNFFNENALKIKENKLKIDSSINLFLLTQGTTLKKLDYDKPFMKVSNFRLITQFIINRDNTVEPVYLSKQILWQDGKEFEPTPSSEEIKDLLKTKIYKNKSFFLFEEYNNFDEKTKQALSLFGASNKAIDDFATIAYFIQLEEHYLNAESLGNIISNNNESSISNNNENFIIKEYQNNGIKLKVEIPSSIKKGDIVNIKVSMTNDINEGKSKGGITIGFPQLPNIEVLNNNSTLNIKNYPKNSKIWNNIDKKQIFSLYSMQEGWSDEWSPNATKEINFSFNSNQLNFTELPYLEFEVRSILINNKKEFLNPSDGEVSQQGYKNIKFNIPIKN